MNAGTFNLTSGINIAKSSVTLRGAGPDQTIIKFTGSSSCDGPNADVCLTGTFNWTGTPQNLTTWTGGYAKGATQITLGSTAKLSVGEVLILDQANDLLDTGEVFVCDNPTADATHTGCDMGGNTGSPGRTVNGVDYNQQQYVQVTAINGNTVTISPGLYMPNWRSSQSPSAWWANAVIDMSGVEDLTLDHSASNETSGLVINNAYSCWVKNVKSLNANRNHVWLQYSAKSIVRDSYFYGTLNAAAESYGVEPWMTGDILVENNIFQHVTAPILIGATSGSVFAYNYDIDNYYFNATWMMPGPAWTHDAGMGMNLVEGNEGTGFVDDDIHGSHNFTTVFRNLFIARADARNPSVT